MPNFLIVFLVFSIIGSVLLLLVSIFFQIFPRYRKYQYIVAAICFILILWLPLGLFFGDGEFAYIFQPYYIVATLLLGICFLSSYILIPAVIISKIRKKEYSIYGKTVIVLFCILINIHGLYAWFVPTIQKYTITLDTPQEWKEKKIVVVSDMHYGFIHWALEAQHLIHMINALHPDIILIPGDLFDWPTIDFKAIVDIFQQLRAPIFYVNGNHEEYRNTEKILDTLNESSITVLNDETILFDGIAISGVTYHANRTKDQLSNTLDSIAPSTSHALNILLRHEPTLHRTVESYGYNLVVSWHSHRWQMWPFSIITQYIYGKYAYGLHREEKMYALTTSGVGSWWPPQRFGTRSEIVVVTVKAP